MDIQIERKKGLRILFAKRSLPYWGGMLFLLFAAWLLLRDNASTLRVDAGTLSVAEVTQGDFNDYIRVTGQVEPITTVQLSPLEAGVVERLVVEEGTSVRRGDVLVELSNPSLTLEILNSEAELARRSSISTWHASGAPSNRTTNSTHTGSSPAKSGCRPRRTGSWPRNNAS